MEENALFVTGCIAAIVEKKKRCRYLEVGIFQEKPHGPDASGHAYVGQGVGSVTVAYRVINIYKLGGIFKDMCQLWKLKPIKIHTI